MTELEEMDKRQFIEIHKSNQEKIQAFEERVDGLESEVAALKQAKKELEAKAKKGGVLGFLFDD